MDNLPPSFYKFNGLKAASSTTSTAGARTISMKFSSSNRGAKGVHNNFFLNGPSICLPKGTIPNPCRISSCSANNTCKPPVADSDSDAASSETSSGTEVYDALGGDSSSVEDIEDAFKDILKEEAPRGETYAKKLKSDPKKDNRQKWDAESLKQHALAVTLSDFADVSKLGCNAECSFDKKCLSHVDLQEMIHMKELFWGKPGDRAFLPKLRRENIQNLFKSCLANKHEITGRVIFQIRDKCGKKRYICEAAFLFQLGYTRGRDASDANAMWRAVKKFHFGGAQDINMILEARRNGGRKKSEKYLDAELFIRKAKLLYGDTLPTAEGTNSEGKPVYVIPYETVKSFFVEYKFDAELNRTDASKIAKYQCFRKVFKSMENEIRLLGCKGSLPTCSVCNTAHEMMRNKLAWNDQQRKIVLEFLRLHLKQQQTERLRLEKVKKMCAEEYDSKGMPKYAFVYSDAMTESKGDCPKEGKKRHSNQGKVIKNRLFAVQVVCGPIDAILYISVDQTMAGGANLAVEIQRVAIDELTKMLAAKNLVMPRTQYWQFDNCGENKNKTMFCYASLLVEAGYAEEINLSFLVVGHTHCNLDQNFSVLSKKISDAVYIGSPLALHELYGVAHSEVRHRPVVNIQLQYAYDWVTHFKDVVNKEIKYFQVPHRFRIKMDKQYKRAICQYMLFSHEDLITESWLPVIPSHGASSSQVALDIPQAFASCSIQIHEFAVVNGLPDLESYLGLTGDISKLTANARNAPANVGANIYPAFLDMMPRLIELEKTALADQISSFAIEENGREDGTAILSRERKKIKIKADLQRDMLSQSNQYSGYLLWLDFTRVENNPDFDILARPQILPYIPKELLKADDAQCKKLIDAAKITASVAHKHVYEYEHNMINKDTNPYRSIAEATSDFQQKTLHVSEYNWYKERQTWEQVIQIVRLAQENQLAADSHWVLMKPSAVTSGVVFSKSTADILNERMEMVNICRLTLIRKRQHLREEFLPRLGLSAPAAETVKCIFGFNLDRDGCLEKASFNCVDCGAFCCDLHVLHTTHQEADSASILRQQITATASKPANVPTSSNDGSQTPKRPPNRNTRADLNQRFLSVTGRQTLDSKHKALKVKEFQLIVEDLERAGGEVTTRRNIVERAVTADNNIVQPAQQNVVPAIPSNLPPVASAISTGVDLLSASGTANSAAEELLATFISTMLNSNPMLRGQLFSLMQSGNQTGAVSTSINQMEEDYSDDDNFN